MHIKINVMFNDSKNNHRAKCRSKTLCINTSNRCDSLLQRQEMQYIQGLNCTPSMIFKNRKLLKN